MNYTSNKNMLISFLIYITYFIDNLQFFVYFQVSLLEF